MTLVGKLLILAELVVGFGLVLWVWFVGLIISPLLVVNLMEGDWEAILPLACFVLGALGLWGMLQLSMRVLAPEAEVTSPTRLKIFIASGYVAIALTFIVFGIARGPEAFILGVPLLVASHLVYLNRKYLWGTQLTRQRT